MPAGDFVHMTATPEANVSLSQTTIAHTGIVDHGNRTGFCTNEIKSAFARGREK